LYSMLYTYTGAVIMLRKRRLTENHAPPINLQYCCIIFHLSLFYSSEVYHVEWLLWKPRSVSDDGPLAKQRKSVRPDLLHIHTACDFILSSISNTKLKNGLTLSSFLPPVDDAQHQWCLRWKRTREEPKHRVAHGGSSAGRKYFVFIDYSIWMKYP